MSEIQAPLDECGCCEGQESLTPALRPNRPGLPRLAYRAGTHASFKAAQIGALARTPVLGRRLTTRDSADPAIALLDAWAAVADVLTFYQERVANEAYLGTAIERRSILELARSIGYELNPGVAASTYLAFTLEQMPQEPTANDRPLPLPGMPTRVSLARGIKVQSTPGQGEQPQIFETGADVEARVEWNSLAVLRSLPLSLDGPVEQLYLEGVDTRLEVGDALLLVGTEREQSPWSERWDLRLVQSVSVDHAKKVTIVTWRDILGHEAPSVRPAANPKVYVLRQRAALFGHNAPDWRAMPYIVKRAYKPDVAENEPTTWGSDWPADKFKITGAEHNQIDLDAAYPKIRPGSWLALMKPRYTELYRVVEAAIDGRADFTVSAKVTRFTLDTNKHLTWFGLRNAIVYGQSEPLSLAQAPIPLPVFGDRVELAYRVEGLESGRALYLRGKPVSRVSVGRRRFLKRQAVAEVEQALPPLVLRALTGASTVTLEEGQALELVAPPVRDALGQIGWTLRTGAGFVGTVTTDADDFLPEAPGADVEAEYELAFLKRIEDTGDRSTLVLQAPLARAYERASVTVNANVVAATHGESKREVLGSGDAARAFQTFKLKQKPLTYVSAANASGTASTLEVRVNDVRVDAASTLYARGPKDAVYTARHADAGEVTVQFGDGKTGERLPSGAENVIASYRVGIGLAGLVRAGQLNVLMTQALGVRGAVNPLAASGAADPETRDAARANAPLTVLTLDRIVSLKDYEDFARAFAGIDKARAAWLWNGERRFVHVSVAGSNGAAVDPDSDLYHNLAQAIGAARDPTARVQVDSYQPRRFIVQARLRVDARYEKEKVRAAVVERLNAEFAFARRDFGDAVTRSGVMALIQEVAGVQGVDLDRLYLEGETQGLQAVLAARAARWDTTTLPAQLRSAELLTIDPAAIVLGDL